MAGQPDSQYRNDHPYVRIFDARTGAERCKHCGYPHDAKTGKPVLPANIGEDGKVKNRETDKAKN